MPTKTCSTAWLLVLTLGLLTQPANAHFPWLATDGQGQPILFFGESPAERTYHLPEAVEKAEVAYFVKGKSTPVSLEVVDSEEFVGRRAVTKAPGLGGLRSTMTYGVYHGSKLTYYAQHELALRDTKSDDGSGGKDGAEKKAGSGKKKAAEKEPAMRARLFRLEDGGVAAKILWQKEPLAGVKVQLFCDEGHVEGAGETDEQGFVRFNGKQVESGLNGIMVGHTLKAEGDLKGEAYSSASHYLTVTFWNGKKASAGSGGKAGSDKKAGSGKKEGSGDKPSSADEAAAIAPLPEPITSFGAAVADGWLYVYSGHTGTAHDHSRDNLSKHFVRTRTDGSTEWEALPMGPPLQGLAMVSHGGKVYRIGGLDARNAPGDEEDLHSTDSFACFDPAEKKWIDMPSLPSGRSSHNAVVLGDTIYVVGGWTLTGDSDGDWRAGAIAFDLTDPESGWRKLPEPPFRRRALAVGHSGGRVVVIGGLTEEVEVAKTPYFYDPAKQEWSAGPDFPGEGFYGFGLAAWNDAGSLYAGGMEGVLYRLDESAGEWVKTTDFSTARFFHQLMPGAEGELIAIAGAAPDEGGHVATLERLRL